MALKTAIITDKIGSYEARCTTKIALEAVARGHIVYETLPSEISFINGKLIANARVYTGETEQRQEHVRINLEKDVDVIHFRPNPPISMGYLSTLYLLERIQDKVLIINNPEAIIKFPEKILPLQFPEFTPATLITQDIEEIREFTQEYDEVILKPLYEYGGNGIRKITAENFHNEVEAVGKWLLEAKLPIVVQNYLPGITKKGDKRIFFIGGEIAGAFARIPKEGSYVANIAKGGSIHKTTITPREEEFAKILKPVLVENGIYICGIDVIDNLVTEINITSSVGFTQIEELYNEKPQIKLWDIIEEKI